MAITRCPYCHAIVDESNKYCNNCGTQLLFPEDDEKEEEIKGEKIIDAELEDKDYDTGEPPAGAGEGSEEGGRKTGSLMELEEAGEKDEEDEEPEEVTVLEEIEDLESRSADVKSGEDGEAEEAGDAEETASDLKVPTDLLPTPDEELSSDARAKVEVETAAEELTAAPAEDATEEEPLETPKKRARLAAPAVEEEEEVKDIEIPGGPEARSSEEKDREAVAEPGHKTFDTRELEGIGPTVDLGRERLDRLFEGILKEGPSVSKKRPAEGEGSEEKKTGTLPPWADAMKGAAEKAGPGAKETAEGTKTDSEELFLRHKGSDSTIGLPERESTKLETPVLPYYEEEEEEEERTEGGEGEEAAVPGASGVEDEEAAVAIESGRTGEEISVGEDERKTTRLGGLFDRLKGSLRRDKTATLPLPGTEPESEETLSKPSAAPGPAVPPPPPPPVPPAAAKSAFDMPLREEPAEAGEEPGEERPPFNFAVFCKSKVFDVLFVGVFWLVALWVAGRSMKVTLFDLLAVTPKPLLVLFVLLLGIYFFLFKFFLGETLGDRLFREHDRQ